MKKSKCCGAEVRLFGDVWVCKKCKQDCDTIEEVQNEEKEELIKQLHKDAEKVALDFHEGRLTGKEADNEMEKIYDRNRDIQSMKEDPTPTQQEKEESKDLKFLKEMRGYTKKLLNGNDIVSLEMLDKMIEDWIDELESTSNQPEKEWKERLKKLLSGSSIYHLREEFEQFIESLLSQKDKEWETRIKDNLILIESGDLEDDEGVALKLAHNQALRTILLKPTK